MRTEGSSSGVQMVLSGGTDGSYPKGTEGSYTVVQKVLIQEV